MAENKINNTTQTQQRYGTANVLIVDNDLDLSRFMFEILARKGIHGIIANDKKTAFDLLSKGDYNLVFANTKMNRCSEASLNTPPRFDLLDKIKANSPEMPVVMIADAQSSRNHNHQRTIDTVVEAIRAGCCDFLIKPLDSKKIESLLDTFLPNHSVSTACGDEADTDNGPGVIIGKSAKLLQTIKLAERVAPTTAPVLISGESGTGKELISHLVHRKSKRVNQPYVTVNCAALSDTLLESELFGHEKGAFTGAHTRRKGRFEMAHGGTLLLDEISETPMTFQAKLLRVLEQQDFQRVGGNENIKVNVRIISTTNKNLPQEVQQGKFRHDLYYRLSTVRLSISPLRQRTDDLTELIWHFLNSYAYQSPRRIVKLDPAMIEIFKKYSWPGNVRQLRNVVLTSMILGIGETLSLADVSWLFDDLQQLPQEGGNKPAGMAQNTNLANIEASDLESADLGGIPLVQVEQQAILDTLRRTSGNQTKAAKVLGISDRTLRGKIRQYRQKGVMQLA